MYRFISRNLKAYQTTPATIEAINTAMVNEAIFKGFTNLSERRIDALDNVSDKFSNMFLISQTRVKVQISIIRIIMCTCYIMSGRNEMFLFCIKHGCCFLCTAF